MAIKKNYKNESGFAILLTLGLIALITISALLYIYTSSMNKKTAKNYNNLTTARILVQSAVNRALGSMKKNSGVTADFSEVYTHCVTYTHGSTKSQEYLIDLMPTEFGGISYYDEDQFLNSSDSPSWQYFPTNISKSPDKKIIGRIAYITLADNGKIMPSAAVDSGLNAYNYNQTHTPGICAATEYGSPAAPPSAINQTPVTSITADGTQLVGRPGVDVSEIWLGSLGTLLSDTNLKKLSSDQANPAGKMPHGKDWGNSDQFLELLNIKKDDEINEFKEYFTFGNPPDPEVFWVDNDLDEIKTEDELFHRFNLKRSDWSNITVDSIKASPTLYSTTYNEGVITPIPWLRNWKSSGDMGSSTNCKNQIIANLIDYCDNNNEATTDNEDNPTYVGLEKCPYINEVQINFYSEITSLDLGASRKYDVKINPYLAAVEVINMYDLLTTVSDGLYSVKAIITMDWEFSIAGDIYTRTDGNFDTVTVPITYASAYRYSYDWRSFSDESWHSTGSVNTNKTLPECIIDYIKIKNITVKLVNYSDETFYDFANILNTDITITGITNGSTTRYHSHVDDPRQNLTINDWTDSSYAVGSVSNSFGSINSICNPNPEGNTDNEPSATEPWEISTAFIRNDIMKSPWELGAIHRGKKWQTINLKLYNETEGMNGGGNSYTDGDANILDQIKMTANTETYGKINVNSELKKVLSALFYGIWSGSGYNEPGNQPATEMIDSSESETLANAVINAYSSSSGEFKTRAEILRQTDGVTDFWDNTLWLSAPQTNDATQEEIIGKFINLTKAGSTNSIIIIAVAQTINDVGGGSTVTRDINQNGIIDAGETTTNCQFGTYDQYADEITSTQKAFVVVYRNPATNEFKIGRFEYLDE